MNDFQEKPEDISFKFEGPEKKLEIILYAPINDFRKPSSGSWERVVKASGAEIISKIENSWMDAYLLSESSLFVWEDRILMITCGQTQLVNTVPELLRIVDKSNVALAFYERKNFMYPGEQPSDFEEDVAKLETFFKGKSYRLGPANHDHVHVFFSTHNAIHPNQDVTFQILMTGLDSSLSKILSADYIKNPGQAEKLIGIDRLYPDMKKDNYLFSPYGYSLNAIKGTNYATIHVTPQPVGSYASFETNIINQDYARLVSDVTSIFRPDKYSLLLTASRDNDTQSLQGSMMKNFPGFRMTEKSIYEFDCGYSLTFLNLESVA